MNDYESKVLSVPYPQPDAYGSLSMPVYNTAAFEFKDAKSMENAFLGRSLSPAYSRISNPTVMYLENRVRAVTNSASVTALNTGMAAITYSLMAVAAQGKNIVISKQLFGNTISFIRDTLGEFGVETRYANMLDADSVEEKIDDNTVAVFFEIISNPQMTVVDIKAIAEIAHRHDVPVIVDSTIVPFTRFHARDFGADIEVISSTKYISGGATGLGGLLIDYGQFDWAKSHSPALKRRASKAGRMAFTARVKTELITNLGALMTPQAAYMETLGLETLDIRFERQSSTALWLARELCKVKDIYNVNYTGLESNKFYDISLRQFGPLPGAMLTIDLDTEEHAISFINNLKLIRRATNLFDNKSLAIHPATTIFALFTPEELKAMDVRYTTVRLSIGLEGKEALLNDILSSI